MSTTSPLFQPKLIDLVRAANRYRNPTQTTESLVNKFTSEVLSPLEDSASQINAPIVTSKEADHQTDDVP